MLTAPIHRAWTRTTDAATEPITLAEAKQHLREDSDDLAVEAEINGLITAARQYVEEETGRSLITQTWSLTLDAFPCGGEPILIPRPPLIEVTEIAYLDQSGSSQTWASSNYRVDGASDPGRVSLEVDRHYPLARNVSQAVTITYTAGYGTASAVPQGIKQAMYLLIGSWYTNRENEVVGSVVGRLDFAVKALLAPYKVYGFG